MLDAGCQFADFEATTELGSILESVAIEIVKIAITLARHANRKTLMDADIKLAHEQWLGQKVKP